MNKLRLMLAALILGLAVFAFGRPPATREARAQDMGIILRASGWNISSVTSGSAVFASNITATQAGSVMRVCVVLGSSVPLAIRETDGTHTFTSYLNGGTALTAGCYYTFVFESRNANAIGGPSSNPTAFNFIVAGPSTVPVLRVTEVIGAVD